MFIISFTYDQNDFITHTHLKHLNIYICYLAYREHTNKMQNKTIKNSADFNIVI